MKKDKILEKDEEYKLRGLSNKDIKIVSELEFNKKYYFKRENIAKFFKNKKEMINTLFSLNKKGRIVKLNKNKYFLVPIKARIGRWTDEPFIIIDETMEGKDYFIGGYGAANYWGLTDQIPFKYEVYTIRRQGKYNLLGVDIIFRRTTKERIRKVSCERIINGHPFKILNKAESRKWIKLRE